MTDLERKQVEAERQVLVNRIADLEDYVKSQTHDIANLVENGIKKRNNVYMLVHEAVLDYNRHFDNQERLNALLDAFSACTNNHYSIMFEYEHNPNRPFHKQRIIKERIIANGIEVTSNKVELEDWHKKGTANNCSFFISHLDYKI